MSTRTGTLFPYTTLFRSAGGGFRKRAGCAGRHIDGAGLLIGYRRHETPAVVADAPKQIGGEIRAIALFGDALTNAEAETLIVGPRHEVDGARSEERRVGRECGST